MGKGKKHFVVTYNPTDYKEWVEEFLSLWVDKEITKFLGPVEVWLCFDVQKPRTSKLLYPSPDADNYAKAVLDGLTKIGMWEDDKQVCALHVIKRFVRFDDVVNNSVIHLQIAPYHIEEAE